jgi:hypothetical protein
MMDPIESRRLFAVGQTIPGWGGEAGFADGGTLEISGSAVFVAEPGGSLLVARAGVNDLLNGGLGSIDRILGGAGSDAVDSFDSVETLLS